MSMPDHYAALGLSNQEATAAEIKKAFIKVSNACHPDRDASEEAKVRYDAALTARSVLLNPEDRRIYDRQRLGRSAPRGASAANVTHWTAAQGDQQAKLISQARRIGETAGVAGDVYSVQLVRFGTGPQSIARAALCCADQCLETDAAGPPSDHAAADQAAHRRFARVYDDVAFQMQAATMRRADNAALCAQFRQVWCADDATLGIGNRLDIGGAIYNIGLVGYLKNGEPAMKRVLMRDSACLEELPETADPVRFASTTDFDMFTFELDRLGEAIEIFHRIRADANRAARKVRNSLEVGDGFSIAGTAYTVNLVNWTTKDGADVVSAHLCADGHPLEERMGLPVDLALCGSDFAVMRKFMLDENILSDAAASLNRARSELSTKAALLVRDLVPGDQVVCLGGTVHVETVPWATDFSSGTTTVVCLDDIAMNPRVGTRGYRRATHAEATRIVRDWSKVETALRPIASARVAARRQVEREQAAAQWQASVESFAAKFAEDQARRDAEKAARKAQRAANGGLFGLGKKPTDPGAYVDWKKPTPPAAAPPTAAPPPPQVRPPAADPPGI